MQTLRACKNRQSVLAGKHVNEILESQTTLIDGNLNRTYYGYLICGLLAAREASIRLNPPPSRDIVNTVYYSSCSPNELRQTSELFSIKTSWNPHLNQKLTCSWILTTLGTPSSRSHLPTHGVRHYILRSLSCGMAMSARLMTIVDSTQLKVTGLGILPSPYLSTYTMKMTRWKDTINSNTS